MMSGLIEGHWSTVLQNLTEELDKLKRKVEILERQSEKMGQRIKTLEDERGTRH
jgi:chaperonin cofactor prefoldin